MTPAPRRGRPRRWCDRLTAAERQLDCLDAGDAEPSRLCPCSCRLSSRWPRPSWSSSRRSSKKEKQKCGVVDDQEHVRRDGSLCGRKGVNVTRASHEDAELCRMTMARTAASAATTTSTTATM
eukprot:7314425-Heterocapsa_arctica.AAC.1